MNIHVLNFDSTGVGHCLYTEQLDLPAIGPLEITRASNIEFNSQTQQWEVKTLEEKLLYSHPFRTACLAWEHQKFNR